MTPEPGDARTCETLVDEASIAPPRTWRHRMGGTLWHHPDFLKLWGADAVSQFGTQVTLLALPLLAVTVLQATTFQVGLLTTFETIAFLIIGLPAGAWIDRMRHRNVLIVNDLIRAVVLGSLPIAALMGVLSIGQMYFVAVVFGISTVFFDVSYQSYLPILVTRDELVEGNAKLEATRAVAQVGGPGLGGLLIHWLRPVNALVLDSLSYLWSAFWVSRIAARQDRPVRKEDRNLVAEIKEGLEFVVKHRLLRAIAMTTATSNFFSAMSGAILIVLLARVVGLNAGTIGLLFSVAAIGGFIGVAIVGRMTKIFGQGPTIWISILIASPGLYVAPFMRNDWTIWLFAAGFALVNIGIVTYNITQISFRQGLCPPRLLGRMNATMRFIVFGTLPLGSLVGGALGTFIGVRPTMLVGAIGGTLAVLPAFLSPLRRMRELPSTYETADTRSAGQDSRQADGSAREDDGRPPQDDAVGSDGGAQATTRDIDEHPPG